MMELTVEDIEEETSKKKSFFYHCPLARKMQRVFTRRGRCGKVKVYTLEEIEEYKRRKRKEERA